MHICWHERKVDKRRRIISIKKNSEQDNNRKAITFLLLNRLVEIYIYTFECIELA